MLRVYCTVIYLCIDTTGHAFAQPLEASDNPSQQSAASESASQSDESASEQEPSSAPDLVSVKPLLPALSSEQVASQGSAECDEACQRAKDDLSAQQGMMWAAWAMFGATVASIIIGLASLFLIWRTVAYTREGAVAARDAVSEAVNATEAARAAVAETKRIGEAQVRAYVQYEPIAVTLARLNNARTFGSEIGVIVTGRVWNTGQTPVVKFDQRFRITECDMTAPLVRPENVNLKAFSATSGEVGRDKGQVNRIEDSITIDKAALVSGKRAIRVVGCITYLDVFGESHESWFDGIVAKAGALIDFHDRQIGAGADAGEAPVPEWIWIRVDQYQS